MMPILTSLISVDNRSLDKVMQAGKTGPYVIPMIAVATAFSTSEFTSQIVICITMPVPSRNSKKISKLEVVRPRITLLTSAREQGQNMTGLDEECTYMLAKIANFLWVKESLAEAQLYRSNISIKCLPRSEITPNNSSDSDTAPETRSDVACSLRIGVLHDYDICRGQKTQNNRKSFRAP